MGYQEARIVDGDFEIPDALAPAALADLRAFVRSLGYEGDVADLTAAFRLFELAASPSRRGGIAGLAFQGRLLLELEDLFHTVAPYVSPGCYLHWRSGVGAEWRYLFDGEQLHTAPD